MDNSVCLSVEAEKIETQSNMYGPGRLGPIVIV